MNITTRSILSSVAVGSISTLALSLGGFDRAQAATISLGNTGTGTYSVVGPAGATNSTAIIPNGTPPNVPGSWFQNTATSSWIGSTIDPTGNYTYTTTFDLTGLDPTTASIFGEWAGDNQGVSILLNNSSVGIATNPGSVGYTGFTPFSINNTAAFSGGTNTLAFTIFNFDDGNVNRDGTGPNPTGLRVELAGTADALPDPTAVPEPSDLMGTAFAFGSVVLLKRKLSKKTTKSDSFSK
jgi:hypothetical protein